MPGHSTATKFPVILTRSGRIPREAVLTFREAHTGCAGGFLASSE